MRLVIEMNFAEFFAGIGLVRLGLERAGWSCVFANDIDGKKFEMYRAQFPHDPEGHFVCDDIRNVRADLLPDVQLATASFPCTDLSLAGARAGLAGEHSSALWPFLEVLEKLKTMRPQLVMLENVPGFLTSHGGGDFRSALLALNRIGYVVDAFVIDAANFVPQSRQRLFVVGRHAPGLAIAEHRNLFGFVESEHRPSALIDFMFKNMDVVWLVRELRALPK